MCPDCLRLRLPHLRQELDLSLPPLQRGIVPGRRHLQELPPTVRAMRVAPQMLSMPLGVLPRLLQLVPALQRRVPHLFHLSHHLPVLRGRALFVGHLVSQMLGADPALQQLSQRIVLSQLRVGLQDRHLKQHVQDVHFALCHLQLVGMSQLRDGLLLLVKCMHSMSQRMCFL